MVSGGMMYWPNLSFSSPTLFVSSCRTGLSCWPDLPNSATSAAARCAPSGSFSSAVATSRRITLLVAEVAVGVEDFDAELVQHVELGLAALRRLTDGDVELARSPW